MSFPRGNGRHNNGSCVCSTPERLGVVRAALARRVAPLPGLTRSPCGVGSVAPVAVLPVRAHRSRARCPAVVVWMWGQRLLRPRPALASRRQPRRVCGRNRCQRRAAFCALRRRRGALSSRASRCFWMRRSALQWYTVMLTDKKSENCATGAGRIGFWIMEH
eukprot:gene1199-biopygen4757